jgi:hypothetical protein
MQSVLVVLVVLAVTCVGQQEAGVKTHAQHGLGACLAPLTCLSICTMSLAVGTRCGEGIHASPRHVQLGMSSSLGLRGGFGADVEFGTDRVTRELEKKLGGREKAKKSLSQNGFGKLLDDLDAIGRSIASTGPSACPITCLCIQGSLFIGVC